MPRNQAIITQREEQLLHLLYTYRYLSLPLLVQGLGYAMTSINHVGELAKRLTNKGLLSRFPLPSTTKGTKSYIYTLTRQGLQVLRSLGTDVSDGWSVADIAPTYMHFAHTLATNELVLAASRLPELVPAITIETITPEWQLRKTLLRASTGEGNTVLPMCADALISVRFTIGTTRLQTTIWVECDRGSEAEKQVRRKIYSLLAITSNLQQLALLNAKVLTVAFATTQGEKRRAAIQTWIERELRQCNRTNEADAFLTTCVSPGSIDPVQLYTKPVWYLPFSSDTVPLIDLSL